MSIIQSIKRKNEETEIDNDNKKKIKEDIDNNQHIDIQNLEQLITFAKKLSIKDKDKNKYPFDIVKLYYLVEPLEKLNNLIGMKKVKKNIVNQIIFHLQELDDYNEHMMHTVIYGPPGVGKTELGKILGDIYCELGILKVNEYSFTLVKRSDLIGRYLGETAIKTQKTINKCIGGVMFIDEVYSLGNPEKRDSFSKECIDVLNQNLSENKSKFICIIAGYKDSVNNCFFSVNEGLERRFPYRYEIDNYDAEELRDIFINLINKSNWTIDVDDEIGLDFFIENKEYFKYNGGDLENLLEQVKISHSRRIFGLSETNRKIINNKDIMGGFENFKINNCNKVEKKETKITTMYT